MHDVCDVCSHVQDKNGGVVHRASELGHNGIKNTDGIICPEFVEHTQENIRESDTDRRKA